jgi:tRNA 2-selenouridine synthase
LNINFEDIDIENAIFIDTRSPAEYQKGHIVGAINIPLLDNEQRAIVGTIYKRAGQESAIKKGLELSGPNFVNIYTKLLKLQRKNIEKKLIIYCARGGMRSGSVHSFMSSLKINSYRLVGGYKRYRNIVLNKIENINDNIKFIILTGHTGSGKTTILKKMQKRGLPIIDLEGEAKHMGSAFGAIPYNQIRMTQQQFENRLATSLIKLKNPKVIFLEGESKRFGLVNITKNFYEKMVDSDTIIIKRSDNYRIKKILDDYDIKDIAFKDALSRISKKLGGEKYKEISIMLENSQDEEVIRELLINYYDKLYNHSINKHKNIIKTIKSEDDNTIIDELIKLYMK